MNGSTKIFRIFGIDIKLHYSWWFIFFLLVWSLAFSYFPELSPGLTKLVYWIMGVSAALLLFLSVLLHELSHSLVAKSKNIKVESITLFFFGGVASIDDDDINPKSEFLMAIAGPFFSLFLAGTFYLINSLNGNLILDGITTYLWQINLMLALFNLVPGFPLDGGRALRAALYWHFGSLKKATRIAVAGGKFFAVFMFLMGLINLVNGVAGGIWLMFLGGFLYFIANISYDQVIIKEALSKIPLKSLITKKTVYLSPNLSLAEFVKKYANFEDSIFFVKDENYQGLLMLNRIQKVPFSVQQYLKLKQLSVHLTKMNSLSLIDSGYTAFRKFTEQNVDVLPVYSNKKIIGFVTNNLVMHRLMLALKFGEDNRLERSFLIKEVGRKKLTLNQEQFSKTKFKKSRKSKK